MNFILKNNQMIYESLIMGIITYILGIIIYDYEDNDYAEYNYKGNKYYLPINGFYTKINDFGYTLDKNSKSTNKYQINDDIIGIPKIDCNKCDIYNFIYDLYNGQNLGSISIMKIMENKSKKNILKIKKFFKLFININLIDKIQDVNLELLNDTWSIKHIKFLQKIVKTPDEYLKSKIFDRFKNNKNKNIIIKYNI